MKESSGSLFITPNGGITPATFLVLIGLPLIWTGTVMLGSAIIVLGLLSALKESMKELKEAEKQEIRYRIFEPVDIVAELQQLDKSEGMKNTARARCLASLGALAKKYQREKEDSLELPLLCQQAAYVSLRLFPEEDDILTGAISLLALVAKNRQVRHRNISQAEAYCLDRPISALKMALQRAKVEEDEAREETLAEIQRKGALYMGALADGDMEFDLAVKIVEKDGLEHLLDAANWFRLHEGVANWALWAIFIICYENVRNKIQLVRLGGITTVCELMKSNPGSLEVNRHGVAILFDLLREGNGVDGVKWDHWEVRKVSLGAGLHQVLLNAMREFPDSMDVVMMGHEMLIGTGYRGDIPQAEQH
jgi:hypothetical protein